MANFQETLANINKGSINPQLDEKLRDLIQAVRLSGKAGAVSLTLKVAPLKGNAEVVTVEPAVTVKLPVSEAGKTVFFTTEKGELVRNDPRQQELPGLRTIEIAKGNFKEAI